MLVLFETGREKWKGHHNLLDIKSNSISQLVPFSQNYFLTSFRGSSLSYCVQSSIYANCIHVPCNIYIPENLVNEKARSDTTHDISIAIQSYTSIKFATTFSFQWSE